MEDNRREIDEYLIEKFKDEPRVNINTDHDDYAVVYVDGIQVLGSYDSINYFGIGLLLNKIRLLLSTQ